MTLSGDDKITIMSDRFEEITCLTTTTDCNTIVFDTDIFSLSLDLPRNNFPDIPDELEDILDTACRRYEAFIGLCEGDFSFEEIKAERKNYAHLTTPFIDEYVMEFDLRKCVEYMHLCYGVPKDIATVFTYRFFLIWHYGYVQQKDVTIDFIRNEIRAFFGDVKALLVELGKAEWVLDS